MNNFVAVWGNGSTGREAGELGRFATRQEAEEVVREFLSSYGVDNSAVGAWETTMSAFVSASRIEVKDGRFEYTSKLHPGNRRPVLWLYRPKTQTVHVFGGTSSPGVWDVVGEPRDTRNGKWSATIYTIQVGSAVPVCFLAPLHGTVWGSCATWEEGREAVEKLVGGPIDPGSFKAAALQNFRPAAERWDAASQAPTLE
jgi:hypothetical protein